MVRGVSWRFCTLGGEKMEMGSFGGDLLGGWSKYLVLDQ